MLERDKLIEHVEGLLNDGKPEKARDLCKRWLKKYPRDADVWLWLGNALFNANRLTEAERTYQRACELRPNWAPPLSNRAHVWALRGQISKAKALAEQAYVLDRDDPHTSYVKALCLDLERNDAEATFWYHRAFRLCPESYFPPASMNKQDFRRKFHSVLRALKEDPDIARFMGKAKWIVKDLVDPNIPDLNEISPVVCCHMVTQEVWSDEEGSVEERILLRGYVFRKNILRQCRSVTEVYDRIRMCIIEEMRDASICGLDWDDDYDWPF